MSRAQPPIPPSRGPVSSFVLDLLSSPGGSLGTMPQPVDDPVWGEDSALALHLLYALHRGGFAEIDDGAEWDATVLAVRSALEAAFDARIAEMVGPVPDDPADAATELRRLSATEVPSLSAHMASHGTIEQFRELAIHHSIHQLEGLDPLHWAIARVDGPPRAALLEIQRNEYGVRAPVLDRASLFQATLHALGLAADPGAYLCVVPGTTLAVDNLASYLGLHRNRRGALIGHLAHTEMCAALPMARYAAGLRRLGIDESGIRFFDAHVGAGGEQQRMAIDELVLPLLAREPELAGDVVHGARASAALHVEFEGSVLGAWAAGGSSLRGPLAPTTTAPRGGSTRWRRR